MKPATEAYLDIETTGLSPRANEITVIGIYICNGDTAESVQLVGADITRVNILDALDRVDTIYTYNGSRFDLPFIRYHFGINLATLFNHSDLMYDCWRNCLYGGLKAVEKQLGINRELTEVNGYEAIRLWFRYLESFDLEALDTLLKYNREDTENLKILKDKLI